MCKPSALSKHSELGNEHASMLAEPEFFTHRQSGSREEGFSLIPKMRVCVCGYMGECFNGRL